MHSASPVACPEGRSCSRAAAGANLQSLASGDCGSYAAVPEDRSTTISQFIHLQVRRGGFQARQLPPEDGHLIFCLFFPVAAGAGSRFSSSPSPGGWWDRAGKELKPLKLTAQVVPPQPSSFLLLLEDKKGGATFFLMPVCPSPARPPAGGVPGQSTKRQEPGQRAELFMGICMRANTERWLQT